MWRFDDYTLDTARYELKCGENVVRVEPQVFDVLAQLLSNHERCVTKEELFDAVWGGRFVGEAALTSRIKAVRRALGDDGESQRYIRTVRGRGYQFVGALRAHHDTDGEAESRPEPEVPRQHIAFCRAGDGIRLAYAVTGDGPPLVRAANWMTHLGYDVESPVWRHWVRDMSAHHTFIRYDERGCGLSDWDAEDFTFDDWVADLESVVDAVGLERFPLLGVSQGGAVAVAYAARHPEQVTRLVLCGAYARGRAVRAQSDDEKRAAALDLDLARVGWGRDDPAFRQVFAAQFLPDVVERQMNQSEFVLPIWEYLDIAASEERVRNGRTALRKRRELFIEIERRFGVEPEVVAAIWGLESGYGVNRGSVPILSALATLAWRGSRQAFKSASVNTRGAEEADVNQGVAILPLKIHIPPTYQNTGGVFPHKL